MNFSTNIDPTIGQVENITESQTPHQEQDQPQPAPTTEEATTYCVQCQKCIKCCLPLIKAIISTSSCLTVGSLLVIGGLTLMIGADAFGLQNAYYLFGPVILVLGLVLLLKGCLNKVRHKSRKTAREVASPTAETSEQRLERIERAALADSNNILPPRYCEVNEAHSSSVHRRIPRYSTQSSQVDIKTSNCRVDRPSEKRVEGVAILEDHNASSMVTLSARPIWTCDSMPELNLADSMVAQSSWSKGKHDKATDTSDLPMEINSEEELGRPPSYSSLGLIAEQRQDDK